MDEKKAKRRTSKTRFTRQRNVLEKYMKEESIDEITAEFEKLETLYNELQDRHDEYCETVEDEEQYEQEEQYIQACMNEYMDLKIRVKHVRKGVTEVKQNAVNNDDTTPVNATAQQVSDTSVEPEMSEISTVPIHSPQPNPPAPFKLRPRMEKPKLPVFNGDVREYHTFKDDFRHMIDPLYGERDAVTILRNSLTGKPLDLLKGIGTDYAACWEYLDLYYGDPRVISDVVAQDLTKFKPLNDGEDSRFCEFTHLIRRCFNILKQVGKESDMDNNHMLAQIERKMTTDDRKVFARQLQQTGKEASLEGLMIFLQDEMKSRRRATATIRSNPSPANHGKVHVTTEAKQRPTTQQTVRSERWKKCWCCETDEHWPDQCPTLQKETPEKRLEAAKQKHVCFGCLKRAGKGHSMNTCNRKRKCPNCESFHHQLLHNPKLAKQVNTCTRNNDAEVLPMITATIGQTMGNVVFDSCASITLIRDEMAQACGFQSEPISIEICTLGGETKTHQTRAYKVKLKPYGNNQEHTLVAIGVPAITTVNKISQTLKDKVEGTIGEEIHRNNGDVDVLIGVNYGYMHTGETKEIDGYVIRRSPLGWVVFGSDSNSSLQNQSVMFIKLAQPVDLTKFWTTEEMGVRLQHCVCKPSNQPTLTPDDQRQYSEMKSSCTKVNGRWEVPYPWKRDPSELPDNRKQVMAKLISIEQRLKKDPVNAKLYDDQMSEMEAQGFSRKLTKQEIANHKGPVHYISHHPVIRPEKKSTPVRIVFNSSASFNGHRLNEYWQKGPDLLNDMFGVLMRFRQYPVAVSADIAKMYHQVTIPEQDKHVHRFLWRKYEQREPDVFVKEVVTFGDMPAPAMALTALRKTAEEGSDKYPEAARTINEDTYMDDICSSTKTVMEARKLTEDIDVVLEQGGFKVKGWTSNVMLKGEQSKEKMTIIKEEQKVLGVTWDPETDYLQYQVKAVSLTDESLTKRIVLSELAKIFDPIGFTGAFLIRGKMLMQKLWQRGIGWDDGLNQEENAAWRKFFAEIQKLDGVSFPRCLLPTPLKSTELVLFCDASEEAFGVVAYTRNETLDGSIDVRFVAAKSRVAPLKCVSIPRLELQAAVLAARLYATIKKEMTAEIEGVTFLSDSVITLTWIRGQSRLYKAFVANRVAEIQNLTDPADWRHIPGENNVSDKISRGISVNDLNGEWKDGPEFLRLARDQWPQSIPKADLTEVSAEKKNDKSTAVLLMQEAETAIDYNRFSSWRKLIRVTSYVFRFISNLKAKCLVNDGSLSVEELATAEQYWIFEAQKPLHEERNKGKYHTLSTYVKDLIICVGGRVQNDVVCYDTGHPVLLPKDHHISYLITKDAHDNGHYGVATTSAKVRRNYWIIGVNRIAKKVKYQCVKCRMFDRKRETQLMADLPAERLAPFTPPFYFTACDYFGPYVVKISRNKTAKHYGVIFTCLNTRAIHLEVATDCTTMEFIQVLRRFLAIRGHPHTIQSDNGTQFVGAERQLREMVKGWNKDELNDFCAERQVKWKFTTPLAPHQNGCAESLVKSCKHALKKSIGEQKLRPFELHTCFQEIANLVNERPIGRMPTDPDDGSYICPNDILLGRASSRVPQGPFQQTKDPRERVRFVQQIVNAFWKSWTRDVFPLLVPRKKWNVDRRNVKVNDVVIIADPNAVRGQWKLGRVTEVFPGTDNRVRNVKVKTANGSYQRSVTKIVVICPVEGYN